MGELKHWRSRSLKSPFDEFIWYSFYLYPGLIMELWEKCAAVFGLVCGLSLAWVQIRHFRNMSWGNQGWDNPEMRQELGKPVDSQDRAALWVALLSFLLMVASIGLWFR